MNTSIPVFAELIARGGGTISDIDFGGASIAPGMQGLRAEAEGPSLITRVVGPSVADLPAAAAALDELYERMISGTASAAVAARAAEVARAAEAAKQGDRTGMMQALRTAGAAVRDFAMGAGSGAAGNLITDAIKAAAGG